MALISPDFEHPENTKPKRIDEKSVVNLFICLSANARRKLALIDLGLASEKTRDKAGEAALFLPN